MKSVKIFSLLFALELFVIAAVVSVFRLIENRLTAGALAGTLFVALGVGVLWFGWKNPLIRKTASIWMAAVHLFVSALPLLITRLMNHGSTFSSIDVLGLPGPSFHRLSSAIYLALMIATLFDLAYALRVSAKSK